jgi:hypothetical protein
MKHEREWIAGADGHGHIYLQVAKIAAEGCNGCFSFFENMLLQFVPSSHRSLQLSQDQATGGKGPSFQCMQCTLAPWVLYTA